MVRNPVQSANSKIEPFASRVLNLTQPIHKKSENLQWEKCRYITDIEKTFSDTAQYFHSKHLKNGPKRHEKYFFQWNGILRPKRYFPKFIASCSFMPTSPNFEVHYVGPKMFVFIHKQILLRSFEWLSLQILHVWAKTPDWPLWPKSSEKKEDFDFKSDFI